MSNAYKLIIEDDEGRRSVVPVEFGEESVSVGRDAANTICLNERNVSRRHAQFTTDREGVYAEDLSSFNGVWVNGQRIQAREAVFEGDIVRIGDFSLELRGEGLRAREEEATERMDEPPAEATQPSYNLLEESSADMMAEGGPAPIEPLSFEEDTTLEAPAIREEKTAIIRMPEFSEVPAADGNTAIAGERAKLVCVSTQLAGQSYDITKVEMVLGRTDDNDIPLPHRSVSRHHARIAVEDGRYLVIDQTSANGTLVNGEEYAQVEVKSGDLIELGHVKLRFVPPGETYSLTDDEIEALKEADEVASRDSGAFEKVRPEPTDVREPPKNRSMMLGLVALVGALVIVWFIVDVLVGPASEGPKVVEPVPVAEPAKDTSTIDEVLKKARVAASERRWSSAGDLVRAALLLEPGNVVAAELEAEMMAERKAQEQLEQARTDIIAEQWEPAWNSLRDIPESSVYHADALTLLHQARGALISQRIAAAQVHIEAGRFDEADALAIEIAALDPSRPELVTIQDQIRLGREQVEKAARRSVKRTAPKPSPTPAPAPATKAPPPPPPQPTPPALSAPDLFSAGVNAVKKKNFEKALEFYRRCIQVDKDFGQCYRALGIVYARTGDAPKAARYYKLYLKVNPGAPDAARVRELLKDYENN
ncbi:MAG: FHA domain-containing protein [Myxococcota bacterium]|nr:FHA domain-containing protein [Myxococcota bacterium]